ncbi:alpha/beta hydrolase [Williamsia sp. 1138]|uniref:alpha/beta fold hydrolase n=1 Tax=Williamsia sp. 1138 TaxID=1903117 RepID=UPI000A0FDBDB|nr:alpha/beta hydrolase [Williamsia sp. 1138]OZG30172.1 alpha/beta hydrolase [Williamsia sp. 1138]
MNKKKVAVGGAAVGAGVVAAGAAITGTFLGSILRAALLAPDPVADQPDPLLETPRQAPEHLDVRAADGTALNVVAYGPPDGELMVLVHGWTCSTHYWYPQINAFGHRYRVIAYDQRGHGDSPRGKTKLSVELLGQDLQAVLTAVVPKGRRALVAGHSMGGMTILSWAKQFPQAVPEVARAVVLTSTCSDHLLPNLGLIPLDLPTVLSPMEYFTGRLVAGATVHLPRTKMSSKVTQYIALNTTSRRSHVDFVDEMVAACPGRSRGKWGNAMVDLEVTEGLDALVVPTVVVVGADDKLTPKVHADAMAAVLRGRGHLEDLVVWPGIGHMSSIENAEGYNTLLTDLLDRTAG